MKNLRFLLSCLACCFFTVKSASAQYYYYNTRFYESPLSWELGVSAAGMNCLTDLGIRKRHSFPLRDLHWNSTRLGIAVSGRAIYKNKLGCRLQSSYGRVAAYDSLAVNRKLARERYDRRLQFESTILEALVLAELYPLSLLTLSEHPTFMPYIMAGLGYFGFNPVAKTANGEVRLQPLRTEGQGFAEHPDRKAYALNQWNLPFGLGVRYECSAILMCSIEVLYRKLFTDYLDDVSKTYIDPDLYYKYLPAKQAALAFSLSDRNRKNVPGDEMNQPRGNPENKDAYLSFNLKVAVALGREKR